TPLGNVQRPTLNSQRAAFNGDEWKGAWRSEVRPRHLPPVFSPLSPTSSPSWGAVPGRPVFRANPTPI
ncbi:MAG: hypothetical protein ACP5MD_01590, partial [Verrucomicrobiia bacterium]